MPLSITTKAIAKQRQVSLLTLSLPVYQNAHVNGVCEKVHSIRCLVYFQCSTVNIYKYKGKYLLKRIPHVSHGSFNPFDISKNQESNGNWRAIPNHFFNKYAGLTFLLKCNLTMLIYCSKFNCVLSRTSRIFSRIEQCIRSRTKSEIYTM